MKMQVCLFTFGLIAFVSYHSVESAKTAAVCTKATKLAADGKLEWCSKICAVSGRDNTCLVDLCTSLEDVCEADSPPAFARALLKNTLNAYSEMAEQTTDITAQEFAKIIKQFQQSDNKPDTEKTVKELEEETAEAFLKLGEGKEGATQFAAQVVESPDILAQRVVNIAQTMLRINDDDDNSKRDIFDWLEKGNFKFSAENQEKAKDTIKVAIGTIKETAHNAIEAFGKAALNVLKGSGDRKRDILRRADDESIEEILKAAKAKMDATLSSATETLEEL